MPIYLDSSAIVKLVVLEPESSALIRSLDAHTERVTSVISTVEVPRAVRRGRSSRRALDQAATLLASFVLIEADGAVRDHAAKLEPDSLRTIDAIHIASALVLGDDLDGFVTYDAKQAGAAELAGLEVTAPS